MLKKKAKKTSDYAACEFVPPRSGNLAGGYALPLSAPPPINAKEMGQSEGVLVLVLGSIGTYFCQGVQQDDSILQFIPFSISSSVYYVSIAVGIFFFFMLLCFAF